MTDDKRRVWWGDFRAPEFKNIDPEAVIAVVPVAAIEQHGPHLSVSTDTAIMEGMLAETIALLPADLDIRILPVQPVGKSNEHIFVPGTLTISPSVLIEAWTELGASIAHTGIRKIVFVNSHGGNEEAIGIVTRELRVRHAMMAVKTSWERFGRPEGLFSAWEERYGIHGGDVETSLMLHFRPELVDMAKAEDFPSRVLDAEQEFDLLRQTGKHAFAWVAGDLNPHGVVGNAAAATAEKGRATAEFQAEGFVRLLQDIRNAKLRDWLA
jgi:creatinine amidohydrolase